MEGGASFCLEVPPDLVNALREATPEQMQEFAKLLEAVKEATPEQIKEATDAAVCLKAEDFEVYYTRAGWVARASGMEATNADPALALHALREAVEGKVTT